MSQTPPTHSNQTIGAILVILVILAAVFVATRSIFSINETEVTTPLVSCVESCNQDTQTESCRDRCFQQSLDSISLPENKE